LYFVLIITSAGNELTGPLPTEFTNLVGLKELFIAENLLTGVIPSGMGTLPLLERFHFHGNLFEGDLDETICDGGEGFRSESVFADVISDCIVDVVCSCCGVCCDDEVCCEKDDNGEPVCSPKER